MRTDEQAIRDLIANWIRATAAGDLPYVLSLMAEDVVFLTPANPPMRGRDAFAASFQSMGPQVQIEGKSEVQEVQIMGDWAYCWSNLTVTITPKQGGPTKQKAGHILSIFRKQSDGAWLLYRDANLLT